MQSIIDRNGNIHEYQTLTVHDDSICLDGERFIQGTMADFTPVPTPITHVTRLEFKALFTGAERVAIKKARAIDDLVEDFFSMVEDPDATGVDLTLPSTEAALFHLEGLGILTEERHEQILAGMPQ